MSSLREQLQAARDEYRSARYPGDLAHLASAMTIAPAARKSTRIIFNTTFSAAAAIMILLAGLAIQSVAAAPAGSRLKALIPTSRDLPTLPARSEMTSVMKKWTPPETNDVLMDVKQPLVSSGRLILGFGKDLAHHADALFHMG